MTTFFEAPDGHGQSTIWAQAKPAVSVISEADVELGYWPEIVQLLTRGRAWDADLISGDDPDDDACMECFGLVGRGEPHRPDCSDYLAPMVDVHLPGDAVKS